MLGLETEVGCAYCDRTSDGVVLLVSLLVLRSVGLSDCACLAARAESFIVTESLLLSPFSGTLAIASPSSSSPEPDGRLLISRSARQTRQHPDSPVATVRGGWVGGG